MLNVKNNEVFICVSIEFFMSESECFLFYVFGGGGDTRNELIRGYANSAV